MWLDVKVFPSDVCRVLGFVCHLERYFRVYGSRYRFFIVLRERNMCVRVTMRLVDFFRVLIFSHEYIMVLG